MHQGFQSEGGLIHGGLPSVEEKKTVQAPETLQQPSLRLIFGARTTDAEIVAPLLSKLSRAKRSRGLCSAFGIPAPLYRFKTPRPPR
jgi:hypothetical protein